MGSIDGSSKEQYERIVAFLLKYKKKKTNYNTAKKNQTATFNVTAIRSETHTKQTRNETIN